MSPDPKSDPLAFRGPCVRVWRAATLERGADGTLVGPLYMTRPDPSSLTNAAAAWPSSTMGVNRGTKLFLSAGRQHEVTTGRRGCGSSMDPQPQMSTGLRRRESTSRRRTAQRLSLAVAIVAAGLGLVVR